MTKFATFALALGLSASTALAGGYVAPVVDVEPVVVDTKPASTNAGLVVPALLLLGVIAAVASDNNDDDEDECANDCTLNDELLVLENLEVGVSPIPDYDGTLDSMGCADFDVEDNGLNFVSSVEVELGITNDWVGDLTIKDVTQPVTIDFDYEGAAVDPYGNQRIGFEGRTKIARSDFGLTFNATLETGGVLVSEDVTLEFEISAIKNA